MSNSQDLVVNLYGKDISYSDALRKMALVSKQATIEASTHFDELGRRIEENGKTAGTGFGDNLTSWAQSGLAGILGGIAASVASSVMGVVSQAGGAIMSELKSTVIDYNSQLENATIGFTTMLGSGKQATDFLNTLQQFAQRTPFQFGDVVQYAQQMIGYGIKSKDVLKDLSALGDAASGTGRLDTLGNAVLAFEQMSARGKIDLGDLNQLSNAGVPALQILANAYHVTGGAMLKMISSGKVMASDALPKLTNGIENGTKTTAKFGGMMDKQSATFTGAMSNIQDSIDQTLSTAFKPFYTLLEQGASALSKFATSKDVQNWAKDVSKWVGGTLNEVVGAIKKVFADPTVQKSIGQLGGDLKKAFQDVGPTIQKMLPDAIKFGKEVIPAIVNAVDGIVKHFPEALGVIQKFGHFLADNAPAIAGFISGVGKIMSAMMSMSATLDTDLINIESKFNGFRNWLGGFFSGAAGWLFDAGKNIIQGLINGVSGMLGSAIDTMKNIGGTLINVFNNAVGNASPSKKFKQYGQWIVQGLNIGLLGSVSQISAAASTMATAVRSAFADKQISKYVEQSALADIKAMTDSNSKLHTLATERAKVLTTIANLKKSAAGVASTTTTATFAAGNITSFTAPGDAVSGLRLLVGKTKNFTADLKSLMSKGVSGALLTQLVDGWNSDPTTALATANGLLQNPTDLKQILGLESQLNSASRSLGTMAGNAEYGSQIAAATGKEKVLTWEMQKAAQAGLRTVSHDLHVHVNMPAGMYAGTKDDLAKSIKVVIQDAVKKGVIPKNWATA